MTALKPWTLIRSVDEPLAIHVIPASDCVDHHTANDCVCGPRRENVESSDEWFGVMYTHHSLDGREASE